MEIRSVEVMEYLRPNGGWVQRGSEYEGIEFLECEPFTKKEYTDAFSVVATAKAKTEADKVAAKQSAQAKLAALGLTEEEVASILG